MLAWPKNMTRLLTSVFDNYLHEYLDLWGNYTVLIDLYSKLLPKNHFGTEILLKNKGRRGTIIGNLGLSYFYSGKTNKAIEYYEQAIKIYKVVEDGQGEGNQLANLGVAYSYLGEDRKINRVS
ncbi:MAG: tetratricopeptide repeat protein [Methanosarcina barkeri]|nr:tetratricopeptide repeat protein [Methanosarcina sp. ERenArc_MAG2]